VLFTVYGQLILKWRIDKYGSLPESLYDKISFLLKLVVDPFIFSGFLAAFIAALFWMAAMTKADMSFAYPFVTAGITLLSVTLAVLLLGETMTWAKGGGVILILAGVIIMTFNNSL
jgi:drug/metabolite transporter (DMT)-like permease